MSISRDSFINSLKGISDAMLLESLAQGATGTNLPPSIFVLRRGILVAGLIALESFVRDRTSEALKSLERWPKSFEDLPEKLRLAARLNALSYLQSFARMLKRQGDEFETELKDEIVKMASGHGTVQQFSKFVAGDFTGNLSDISLKELLSSVQVNDCWPSFRVISSDIGFGVPSVQEIVKTIVRRRHRSAHSAGYAPTATDIAGLRDDLLCVAFCFDVSISASMEQALANADDWADGKCDWRAGVQLYIAKPNARGMRLLKHGRPKAIRVAATIDAIRTAVPRPRAGEIAALIEQDASGRPISWQIM